MHDVVIDPVSRIEGHAKITLRLDEGGGVADARFHVTEFRGFEDFCRGRPVWEMPALTGRTCGICPVSHLLASAKAGEQILDVEVPVAARAQRRLANLGQIVQSHALSFFHLSAPDLLLGMDAPATDRNLFAMMRAEPELVRAGIRLRQFGQECIAAVAGKRIHGQGIVLGGVANPLDAEQRAALEGWLPEVRDTTARTVERFIGVLDRFGEQARTFGDFPSLFLAHRHPDGRWAHDEGLLHVVDAEGAVVAEGIDPADYRTVLGEASGPDSYLKSPYWKPAVAPGGDIAAGIYRVGPLARLNVCERFGVQEADAALEAFRAAAGGVATSSFLFHYARVIEMLACVELAAEVLADPDVVGTDVRIEGTAARRRGVGASEAPRGTLFHDYEVDDDGLVTGVNMLIATGQNNLAMNRTILQIAREHVRGPDIADGVLNRLEAGIRAFDPCLSCSTHALGEMAMVVRIEGPDGALLREVVRD
jgi:NAD-reducing hydrogenase large subunit